MIAYRIQQIREEGSLCVPRPMFTLRMIGGYLRVLTREQESNIFDGPRLTDSRWPIDKRAHNAVAQAARDKFVERLDRWRRETIVAGDEWVLRWVYWTGNLKRHDKPRSLDGGVKTLDRYRSKASGGEPGAVASAR
ncbi:hypothetical protein PT2222_400014 [Paraburkholderia tropica]